MTKTINFLATPKRFVGYIGEIQGRAIANWLNLGDNVRVTVLSDDVGEFLPVRHPRLRILRATDEMRKGSAPEFNEVLDIAGYCGDDYIVYCNSDILFTVGLVDVAEELRSRNWMLCGRRVDLKENAVPPVDPVELKPWLEFAMGRGDAALHDCRGIDYFGTWRKTWRGFGKAFIGRGGIDGALLAHCMRKKQRFADCTGRFWAVHQWHNYNHLSTGTQQLYEGTEAMFNLREHRIRYGPPSLLDADYYYKNEGWCPGAERRTMSRTFERFLRFRLHISGVAVVFAAMRKIHKQLHTAQD
jgi:hypothetical protein